MKYLVAGLESSCTRIVSKLVAYNLNIINDIEEWNAHDSIFNNDYLVTHRSIPHGTENIFIDDDFIKLFDYIVISTRDWNCSLLSKIERHQHGVIEANLEHLTGIETIKNILSKHNNVHIFSSEAAFLLQEFYTIPFLKSMGIMEPKHLYFDNPNRKYLKDIGL